MKDIISFNLQAVSKSRDIAATCYKPEHVGCLYNFIYNTAMQNDNHFSRYSWIDKIFKYKRILQETKICQNSCQEMSETYQQLVNNMNEYIEHHRNDAFTVKGFNYEY